MPLHRDAQACPHCLREDPTGANRAAYYIGFAALVFFAIYELAKWGVL
jgi:hypothetical protein